MLKIICLGCLISFGVSVFGQAPATTHSFVISGEVRSPLTVGVDDLKKFPEVSIGDLVITNHLGEKKSDATGLKGILLKQILQTAELKSENPKVLSTFYFVLRASDGYQVVYSWNELFNTVVGETVYVITEKNGKTLAQMDDAILVVSTRDYKTGRRNVKGLAGILVARVPQ